MYKIKVNYLLEDDWEVGPWAVGFCRVPRFAPYGSSDVVCHDLDIPETGFDYSMRDGVLIDTVAKYNVATAPLPRYWYEAYAYVRARLTAFVPQPSRVLQFEQLVAHGVELSTTPGWPHVGKFKTKFDFFNDADCLHLCLHEDYKRDYLWTSFPKREVIKKMKNVRQICGCEAPFLYHLLPLVHTFNKSIEVAGRGLPFYMGTSFEGEDYQHFVSEFANCSYFLSTDATGWDTSVPAAAYETVADLRCSFLREQHHEKLRFLYRQIALKLVVEPDGMIFQVFHGTPSGQPSTAQDNSIINWIFVSAFLLQYYDYAELEHDVKVAIYGDDCLLGFTAEPPFSPLAIKEFFAQCGIKLKSPEKWLSFEEADFISRRPVRMAHGYSFVYVRHEKLLESARHMEGTLPRLNRPRN